MIFDPLKCHRILVMDDDQGVQELFRRMLLKASDLPGEHGNLTHSQVPDFEVDFAYQGQDGLALVEKSLRERRPYSLAFVDIQMPGWDGIETISKIWEKYCDLQVVICTGYLNYSWEEIGRTLGYLDRFVILNKPFNKIEVLQLAIAMTEKWRLNQQAKLRVDNLEKLIQSLRTRANS
jgi:CheY-like chemotaxis protein